MKTKLTVHKAYTYGDINPLLYGSFIEHMGRAIYGGIYEPDHPTADENGFRGDVLELARDLKVPIYRYPGGNYTATWDWRDGIGPREERRARPDLAWRGIEPNTFGLADFVEWTKAAGAEVLMTVNMGTLGVVEAASLVEYCNLPGGTYWSDLRKSHGYEEPFAIKRWCLGNEPDGPWQISQKSAAEYARLANETAKAMKRIDTSIEVTLAGSSFKAMPTFPQWDQEVLQMCYDQVDYLSLHTYCRNFNKDRATYLAEPAYLESFIDIAIGVCDRVQAEVPGRKPMPISFDEWNVWPRAKESDRDIDPFEIAAPMLEETYTMEDALVFSGMMNVLIRHAERVQIGCMSMLVNVLAPVMTEKGGPLWKAPTFYPFKYAAEYGTGVSLRPSVDCPSYENAVYGDVPYVDVSATYDEGRGEVVVFAVNRSETDAADVQLNVEGFQSVSLTEHLTLKSEDPMAVNSKEKPDNVVPEPVNGGTISGTTASMAFAPFSWNMIRFKVG
jgi:alpha-L-arabinofuranosidase